MNPFADELRLLFCLLLNATAIAAAWRFARRANPACLGQSIADAFLIYFLIKYLSVVLPGCLGILGPASMSVVAIGLSAAFFYASRSLPPDHELTTRDRAFSAERFAIAGAIFFTIGFIAFFLWIQRFTAPMSTDSLVYQLSTAVEWLRHGRLFPFPTWYWNPANTYAPQCGTAAIVWWMAPMHCDVLARYAQAPALLWIFIICYQLCRRVSPAGCPAAAAWVAVALTLSRPLFSEVSFAKDDLYVTAFVGAAVLALSRRCLTGRWAACRVGLSIGFVLASKYTVLMICPIFLFLIDAPSRAGWRPRQYIRAIAIAAIVAAPWYVRNFLLTGNPLYPVDVKLFGHLIFPGLFGTEPDRQLRAAQGVWTMLATTYHSLPSPLLWPLALLWIAAVVGAGKSLLFNPVRRASLLGSAVVLALFLALSPHHEIRYLFPLILLWFVNAYCALTTWLPAKPAFAVGFSLAAVSVATCFDLALIARVLEIGVVAGLVALLGAGGAMLLSSRRTLRWPAAITITGVMLLLIYIDWHAYLDQYRAACYESWSIGYPEETPVWRFAREQIPASDAVAFANTQFTYPLFGFDYEREVFHAPTRRGMHRFRDLPRLGVTVPGDLIVQKMTDAMNADPDANTWLQNLRAAPAKFLVIFKRGSADGLSDNPPELQMSREMPLMFQPVFENQDAVIYRLMP